MGRQFRQFRGANPNNNMLYDDSAFQLFAVSMLAVYWIPAALLRLWRLGRRRWQTEAQRVDHRAREEVCVCSLCQEKTEQRRRRKRWLFRVVSLSDWIFLAATVVLFFGALSVYTENLSAEQPFDPFSILQVSTSATQRQISKAYRIMSLRLHPDKNPGDPTASDKFVKLTKAYAALTDEVARINYKKYGNPDGYQGTSLGIGLPSWVSKNHIAILLFYFALLCVAFPVAIGVWWWKQSKLFTEYASERTHEIFYHCLNRYRRLREYVIGYTGAQEFSHLYSTENKAKVESLIIGLKREEIFDLKKARWFRRMETYHAQNLIVLTAYLRRFDIPPELDYVLTAMLEKVGMLTMAFVKTGEFVPRLDCRKKYPHHRLRGNSEQLDLCIKLSQHIIQAMDEKDSPLLQIPHFTEREVKFCTSSRGPTARTVYAFSKLEPEDQRSLVRSLSEEEFLDVKAFCDRYPQAKLEASEPFVEDAEDDVVRSGDRITIKATLTVIRRAGSVYSPHCPRLPASCKKHEVWWAILSDKSLACPIEVKRLPPIEAQYGNPDLVPRGVVPDPRVTVYEMTFSFMAPHPGTYVYELKADVDCYVGCEKSCLFRVKVERALEIDESRLPKYFDTSDESSSEEESSDEEEDDEEHGHGSKCDCDSECECGADTQSDDEDSEEL